MYVEGYGVILLCFWLLRYVLTMVVSMCFMFVWVCVLFMGLGFVLLNLVGLLSLGVACCVVM